MVLKCQIKDDEKNLIAEFLIDPIDIGVKDEVIVRETGPKELWQKIKDLPEDAFDKIFSVVPFVSKNLLDNVNKLEKKPNEVECEFSLGFDLQGNIILAKAGLNCQFKVLLKWTNL